MKERSKELQKMIANRETELQWFYDIAMQEKAEIEAWIKRWPIELEKKKDELLSANALIEKCKRRAAEQNASDIL